MTEVDLDGAPAQLATITGEDGLQYLVTFELGGLEVIVDANTFDPETYDVDLALDLTLDVAAEVAANMDGRVPAAIDLIDACPAADHPELVEAMDGAAVLAVGTDRGSGELYQQSVACRYANEHMYAELTWQERAEGLEPVPEPRPFSDQQIFEVRGHPVRLLGAQSSGELVADGQCRMQVQYHPVNNAHWEDFPNYPSEQSANVADADKLRDEKTVMFLEAIYDLNGC